MHKISKGEKEGLSEKNVVFFIFYFALFEYIKFDFHQ